MPVWLGASVAVWAEQVALPSGHVAAQEDVLQVAWAALLRGDWRGLTRAASKLPVDTLLALHQESLLTNMSGPMLAYENIGSMSLLGGMLWHHIFEGGARRTFKILYALCHVPSSIASQLMPPNLRPTLRRCYGSPKTTCFGDGQPLADRAG